MNIHSIYATEHSESSNTDVDYLCTDWNNVGTIYGFITEYNSWIRRRDSLGAPSSHAEILNGTEPKYPQMAFTYHEYNFDCRNILDAESQGDFVTASGLYYVHGKIQSLLEHCHTNLDSIKHPCHKWYYDGTCFSSHPA